MLIDTHTHLHDPRFDSDRAAVIARAREAGVELMISVGTDVKTSRDAIALAEQYPCIYATVGVHPHDVRHMTSASLETLGELAAHPKVVGYGEIGLDYYYDHSPRDVQRRAFRAQLDVARALNLPVVIHTREAWEDTFAILNDHGAEWRGVFHCFTGDAGCARRALALGFMVSFSGIVTFPNAAPLRDALTIVPRESLLIETDCPYLAPVPYRGKRNEPAYVRAVAGYVVSERIAQNIDEAGEITLRNAKRLFGI